MESRKDSKEKKKNPENFAFRLGWQSLLTFYSILSHHYTLSKVKLELTHSTLW